MTISSLREALLSASFLGSILTAIFSPIALADALIPVDAEYPPLSYTDASGELFGFDVEVAEQIAKRLQIRAEFIETPFYEIEDGDWPSDWLFSVSSMSFSDERSKRYIFVGPYYFSTAVIFVREESIFKNTSDLEERTFAICKGCIYKDFLQGQYMLDGQNRPPPFGRVRIREFAAEPEVIESVTSEDSRVDAGITSGLFLSEAVRRGFKIRPVGDAIFLEPLYIVVRPDRLDVAMQVMSILESAEFQQYLTTLGNKYFNATPNIIEKIEIIGGN